MLFFRKKKNLLKSLINSIMTSICVSFIRSLRASPPRSHRGHPNPSGVAHLSQKLCIKKLSNTMHARVCLFVCSKLFLSKENKSAFVCVWGCATFCLFAFASVRWICERFFFFFFGENFHHLLQNATIRLNDCVCCFTVQFASIFVLLLFCVSV